MKILVTLCVVGLTLLGCIGSVLEPALQSHLGLSLQVLLRGQFLAPLTYVFVDGYLGSWLMNSLTLFVAGSIIEPAVARGSLVRFVVVCVLVGGAGHLVAQMLFPATVVPILVGSAPIASGFLGAGLYRWMMITFRGVLSGWQLICGLILLGSLVQVLIHFPVHSPAILVNLVVGGAFAWKVFRIPAPTEGPAAAGSSSGGDQSI